MGFLRVFLAAAVVIGHSGPIFGIPMVGGRTAVQCFFVLSGFYMAMVLDTKYLQVSERPWRTFMTSRIARLFPIYFFTAAVSAILVLVGGNVFIGESPQLLPQLFSLPALTWVPIVVSNLIVVTQDWSLFAGINPQGHLFITPDFHSVETPAYKYFLVPQAWTIGLELTFYALAPMLARRTTRTLISILVASIALRLILLLIGFSSDPWSYRFFPLELSLFIAGMLAYRFRHLLVGRVSKHLPLGIVTAALLVLPFTKLVAPIHSLSLLAFPFVFAVFIPAIFEATTRSLVDRWAGELSYPVYMTHIVVISVFASIGLKIEGLAAVLVTFAVGAVVVLAIDRPLENVRQQRLRRAFKHSGIPLTQEAAPVNAPAR